MIDDNSLRLWLEATNERYSSEGMPHIARPLRAFMDFCKDHRCLFSTEHPIAKKINRWFYDHSPPYSHEVGSMYTGVYYYDAAFWPVSIPIIFGQVQIDAFKCLETMPAAVKQMMGRDNPQVDSYVDHWMNCLDYGYGHAELKHNPVLKPHSLQFLGSAHSELTGANSQLLDRRANLKAILQMRMSAEIFLKSILVQELDYSDAQLRSVSHELKSALEKCQPWIDPEQFRYFSSHISIYPAVSARYENSEQNPRDVWVATRLTQSIAAAVTRLYSHQNIQSGPN